MENPFDQNPVKTFQSVIMQKLFACAQSGKEKKDEN
jgi:hypothetical protein